METTHAPCVPPSSSPGDPFGRGRSVGNTVFLFSDSAPTPPLPGLSWKQVDVIYFESSLQVHTGLCVQFRVHVVTHWWGSNSIPHQNIAPFALKVPGFKASQFVLSG
ncbi:hypothetical protein GOODEAATRI_026959 [Goodea atripinnis]|uniref:Uncharacterized protein n=1 Tax=Goodea atripinnis TaxID=208336 RepID=A0ABV0ML14_9TELE